MLTENHSLKSFTLEFDDVSPEGVVYLGAMLAEISLDEIYLRLRGLSRVHLKYLLGLSMAYIDGKRKVIVSVKDHHSFFEIQRSAFQVWDFRTGESDYTQILCIIKTLNHLYINYQELHPDAVCEIFDSLKENQTLQVLDLLGDLSRDGRKLGDNREGEAFLAENSIDECSKVVESIARMLRINKTLIQFSMRNVLLTTSDMCEIADSLKTNKALKMLHLEERKVFDDPLVKVAFIDLLANYNFTLNTINVNSMSWGIETFMKNQLKFDTKMAQGGLQSLIKTVMEDVLKLDSKMAQGGLQGVGTTSDSPTEHNVHDVEQDVGTLQLEKGEGSTKEGCGSSRMAFDKHKVEVEAKDERPRLFLSYSTEMRDFAMQLCKKLKSSNYNVVDKDSNNFSIVVDQCQLAIVVLSNMYVKSNPLVSELWTIVNSKKTNNPNLKVYPLFYKLTLHDLQNGYVPVIILGGVESSLDIALEREAFEFLCEGKNEVSRKANDLVENLSQGRIDVGKFCEEFSELQRSSWPSNGLEFENNGISEEGYLHAVLEEIFHYMPRLKECNSDLILGPQGKLEMESKLSLRQMKPLLESLPMRDFYLLRKFNMAQYLQEKYIQYSSFEEMCPLYTNHEQKDEYGKGRIVAALFPTTFLYHFKVHMFQGPCDGDFLPMLKAVGILVSEKMKKECNQNGVQTSNFVDFVDYGAPLDPRRTIAMCQNFSMKTSDGSKGFFIVQDDLTRAYYYQCNEEKILQNPTIDEFVGVIGVEVTSEEIHVDNIHEDGSSYSGVLGDFSYKIDFDENKQCATKAFGDLVGARFLSKNSGLKCSPLLVIALASAIERKGLTLSWRNGKGHMEFHPKLANRVEVEVEAFACQIQYTNNRSHLGLEIEWGTSTNYCLPDNLTHQRGTNEIANQQVLESNVVRSVGTSGSRDDGGANTLYTMNMQNDIALYNATLQNTTPYSFGIDVAGFGTNVSGNTRDEETRQVMDGVFQNILTHRYASEGRFCKSPTLDVEYPDLENQLLSCQLHEVQDHNYLVVYNGLKARHISIYKAIEQNDVVPKFELTWISDIPIDGGEVQIKQIFDIGLKGRELIVQRDGSNFTQVENQSKPLRWSLPIYQKYLLKAKSNFSSNTITSSMIQISKPNLSGKLKSKNEWVHIIGPQAKYEASYKYWWKATSMEAIVYSRTRYTSGTLLTTETKLDINGIGHIGYCSIEKGPKELKHGCGSVVSRGKFSRPPGSLLDNKVLWGGLEIVLENSSLR